MRNARRKLPTEPYKGVRDFYPEEMALERWIFGVMRRAAERFGYTEYGASLLEPTELYAAKSSKEIVNEQTYTFTDRGGRSVTLRPEMTPTLARMVAAKRRELGFPLRWYSIPNVFRYERPQRGRTREHWQLNCDLFGIPGVEAEVEIISLAHRIMLDFGAKESDFEIRMSDRRSLDALYESIGLPEGKRAEATRLIDRRGKGNSAERLEEAVEDSGSLRKIETYLEEKDASPELSALASRLAANGIGNARVDHGTVRGFDYYTGIVFEVFDTNPRNNRSLFGGGRYDNLLEVFGADPVPAVGFGMGDVTIRDFLDSRDLLPPYRSTTDVYLAVEAGAQERVERLASLLRDAGVNVEVGTPAKSVGDQFKIAERHGIAYAIRIGTERTALNVRDLTTRKETELSENAVAAFLFSKRKTG